jgi:hypothetical protein
MRRFGKKRQANYMVSLLNIRRQNSPFLRGFPFDYATAASLAVAALEPARISGGTGKAPGLAVNRRERTSDGRTILGWNREAFIDEEVPPPELTGSMERR